MEPLRRRVYVGHYRDCIQSGGSHRRGSFYVEIISNDKFKRQITIKDNVRDSMFAAVGAIKSDKLLSSSF